MSEHAPIEVFEFNRAGEDLISIAETNIKDVWVRPDQLDDLIAKLQKIAFEREFPWRNGNVKDGTIYVVAESERPCAFCGGAVTHYASCPRLP